MEEIKRNLKFDLSQKEVKDNFERLCAIQCTLVELAGFFNCSVDLIEKRIKEHYGQRFSEVYRQKRGIGKISLRREMYQKAISGNVVMMIWLSKNYLGMADKVLNLDTPEEKYDEPDYLKK